MKRDSVPTLRSCRLFGAVLGLTLATQGECAALADVVARIKPSIVVVGTFNKLRSPAFQLRGTGFAVADGLTIATNAHVLPPAADVQDTLVVLVRDGESVQARDTRIGSIDRDHDLALLKLVGRPLPALVLSAPESVREGQDIAFTGFPIGSILGHSPVTHRGIISAITPIVLPGGNAGELNEKSIRRLRSGSFHVFQLDATAYPGNSGGPMYDANTGEVLGIINMVFVKSTKEAVLQTPSGISYAIPANYLSELIARSK